MILKVVVCQRIEALLASCVTEFYSKRLVVDLNFHLIRVIITNRSYLRIRILLLIFDKST